ncbi:hypothetical protein [Gordonia sp. KTR9]|uniref:hypothetical protein n=1 Tax=Gordonia sp. KTR9 TaxID=337191 RepID=UPI00027DD78D|nr:hypothetical protein [Gordonia sp. KTR9]AFR47313.1 hypothetical protein KTR9_0647 [Gordonia sp. KTR9]
MLSLPGRRRSPAAPAASVVAAALLVAGCAGDPAAVPAPRGPADLVLTASQLPPGYTSAPLAVADLVTGNQAAIDASRSARVTPEYCDPTSDAALNKQLTSDNSAVLAARDGATGALVELVTTAPRDIDADRLTTTGRCARTTTDITTGHLAGSRVVTEFTELPPPDVDGGLLPGEQMLLTRSDVTTTLTDGGVRRQIGFAGYAVLDRPASGPVTVQLTVSGAPTRATNPPTVPVEPIDPAAFSALFDTAVEQVTTP